MVRLHLSVDAATDVHLLRPDLFRALLLESADLGVQKRARFLQGALPQQGSLLVQVRSRPFVAAVRYDEMRATLWSISSAIPARSNSFTMKLESNALTEYW